MCTDSDNCATVEDVMANHSPSEMSGMTVRSDEPLTDEEWNADVATWRPIALKRRFAITLQAPGRFLVIDGRLQ